MPVHRLWLPLRFAPGRRPRTSRLPPAAVQNVGTLSSVEKVIVSWSGGKDCALSMYEVIVRGEYEVAGLLTTITPDSDRVDMHDIRHGLIEKQAEALGLPLDMVMISSHTSNADYEPSLADVLKRHRDAGVTGVLFGDLFRADLRMYRAVNCARLGLKAIFPLWKRDNLQIMDAFISSGFKAVVTSINANRLEPEFVGRTIDWDFLRSFPTTANVCGEWGEYHTFVYDGPTFTSPIRFTVGDTCDREDLFHRFLFCDLIPA